MPRRTIGIAFAAGLALLACFAFRAGADTDAQGFIRLAPDELQWKTVGDNGVKSAVLFGDPSKPGLYVVRNIFPPGIMSMPHFHDHDRTVVVIKGTWYTGTSRDWDPDRTVAIKAGGFMMHPAGAVHYDGAKDEEAIVQITGIGPVSTVFAHPDYKGFGRPHKLD